jgi:hypothetical protein
MKIQLFLILGLLVSIATGSLMAQTPHAKFAKGIEKSKKGVFTLEKGHSQDHVIFVQGIYDNKDAWEWEGSLQKHSQLQNTIHYYKWSRFDSIAKNADILTKSVEKIDELYNPKSITIFAHSAGGVVALISLKELESKPVFEKVFLHTIAPPIFGYQFGKEALISSIFIGKTTARISVGARHLMNEKQSRCMHWVTTTCELDKHTCARSNGVSPLMGDGVEEGPCGKENTRYIDDEDHMSVIDRVVTRET